MAKKQIKEAMIKYEKEQDMFVIYIRCGLDDEWEMCTGYKCQKGFKNPDAGAEYIHYSALTTIKELIMNGFEFVEE